MILDTNFLIALEKGEAAAVDWLAEHGDEHGVPDFVAVEYLTGHTSTAAALDAIEGAFVILHGDRDWIDAAVALRKALRRKGARFRVPDFWIAAWARYHDTSVVTRNRSHFQQLGVPVETW